ncbi:MAG: phosphoenolpyruvate carboxykinase, partial [Thermoplasmata archaeon]
MIEDYIDDILKERLDEDNYNKLIRIKNPYLHRFIAKYVQLCNPDKIFVSDGSEESIEYIRKAAIKNGEEKPLAIRGHTVHFDGYYDQARDREHTKFLVSKGVDLGSSLRTTDREKGLKEIHEILKDIMKGHELYIC